MIEDTALAAELRRRLRLLVMAGPMFIAFTPALVIAQCKACILGAILALNLCSTEALNTTISENAEIDDIGAFAAWLAEAGGSDRAVAPGDRAAGQGLLIRTAAG